MTSSDDWHCQISGAVAEEMMKKYTSKEFLLENHERKMEEVKSLDTCGIMWNSCKCFPNTVSTECNVILLPENRVRISDIIQSLHKPIIGKFLLCRNLTIPLKMVAVQIVVDDPEGEYAIRLSMYNVFSTTPRDKLSEVLPVGMIMAVKNPYFKMSRDGGLSLRTDNPNDIVLGLTDSTENNIFHDIEWKSDLPKVCRPNVNTQSIRKAGEWKMLGNNYYEEKRYLDAVNAYTTGLKLDPQSILLLSNRAAAYLQMQAYKSALSDVEYVLNIEPSHVKAIFRKGKALCGLKKYKEALKYLNSVNDSSFNQADKDQLSDLKSKVKSYFHQSLTGEYDFFLMLKERSLNQLCCLDLADYIGPVEVRNSPGKGRGLFATGKMEVGTVIIAEKAFAHTFHSSENISDPNTISEEFNNFLVSPAHNVTDALVAEVEKILTMSPEKRDDFYNLYAGPDLNFLSPANGDDTSVIDAKRIKGICTFNSFDVSFKQALIWLLSSMINHSCVDSNCMYQIFGDFIVLRAAKLIEKDEEILISYVPPRLFFDRKTLLGGHLFLCNCRLCEFERSEPKRLSDERKRLWVDFNMAIIPFRSLSDDTGIIKRYVNIFESLQEERPDFNFVLISPLLYLMSCYENQNLYIEAAKIGEKLHNFLNYSLNIDQRILNITRISSNYYQAGLEHLALKWEKKLIKLFGFTGICGAECVMMDLAREFCIFSPILEKLKTGTFPVF